MSILSRFQTQSKHFAVAVVFLGGFTDLCVYSIIIPIIPFVLEEIHEPESWIGILLAIYGLGVIVGSFTLGLMVSRKLVSKKLGMIGSLFVVWASILFFALGHNIWMLCIARFFQGLASCGVWVLGLALVADLYGGEEDKIGTVMGIIFSGLSMGMLLGPPISGWLFTYGRQWPYVFCAGLVGLDLVGRLLIVEPGVVLKDNRSASKEEFKLSDVSTETVVDKPMVSVVVAPAEVEFNLIKLFRFKGLWVACMLCAVLSLSLTQIEPTLPLYLKSRFNYDAAQIGTTWLALVLPNVVGGMLGGLAYDRFGMRNLTCVTIPLLVIALVAVAIPGPDHIGYTCFVLALVGFTEGLAAAPVAPAIADAIPAEYHTMGYVLFNLVFSIGISVGPIVGSVVYDKLGWMYQNIVFAGLLVLFLPLIFWMPRKQANTVVEEIVA